MTFGFALRRQIRGLLARMSHLSSSAAFFLRASASDSRRRGRRQACLAYPLLMDRLFDLPEYERAGREFFGEAMEALMQSKSSVFGMIRTEKVDSLPRNRVALASDQVVETAPITMESGFTLSRSATIAGDFDDLLAALDTAAESGLASLMPQFFANLGEICDAAGQTVDAGGRPLDHDLLLEAIEGVEITFDDEGNAQMPTLVVHPEMADKIAALPPPTPEQDQRFAEMMQRKKEEFFARRRTRQLPRHAD